MTMNLRLYGRCITLILTDVAIISAAFFLGYWFRMDIIDRGWGEYTNSFQFTLPILLSIRLICGLLIKQYTWSFRHSSLPEAANIIYATIAGSVIFYGITRLGGLPVPPPPRTVMALEFFGSLAGMGFIRFAPRYAYIRFWQRMRPADNGEKKLRTLIFGAGGVGELLLRDLSRTGIYPYEIIGFVDDSPSKWDASIHGYRVLGASKDLPTLIQKHKIDKLLIAVPDIRAARLREIVDLCASFHIRFMIVPNYADLVAKGNAAPLTLKNIKLEDLLDRATVDFSSMRMAECFAGKIVLVTGAAGSIGSEICRQVCRHGIKRLIILDINENDLYFLNMDLRESMPNVQINLEVASIRDRTGLGKIFNRYKPDMVFHAAAHKHVPLMEYSPAEAIKNNIIGTRNVAECADASGVTRFVLISTDKAVRPSNVMGASKQLAENIVRDFEKRSKTRFMAVRFGNVLGSNGSLLKILERQIAKGGPITITHPKVTRYFMTIPEAVGLVLVASLQEDGEVAVLDMGEPLSVDRLARGLISLSGLIPEKDIEIVYTGLRAGEKMYEELFTNSEGLTESLHPRIRIAHGSEPEYSIEDMLNEAKETALDGSRERIDAFFSKYAAGYAPDSTR